MARCYFCDEDKTTSRTYKKILKQESEERTFSIPVCDQCKKYHGRITNYAIAAMAVTALAIVTFKLLGQGYTHRTDPLKIVLDLVRFLFYAALVPSIVVFILVYQLCPKIAHWFGKPKPEGTLDRHPDILRARLCGWREPSSGGVWAGGSGDGGDGGWFGDGDGGGGDGGGGD